MKKTNIVFQSKEMIYGYLPKDHEWIRYEGILLIKDKGKSPVEMEMKFIPPHPPWFKMPLDKAIRAQNVTELYAKIVKFFKQYGIDFKS